MKPAMLAALYPNSLVQEELVPPPKNQIYVPEKQSLKYLGNLKKEIIVIVNHASIPFLPDEELSFLTNILSACRLSLADIAIVNFSGNSMENIHDFIQEKAKSVLLFGIDPLSVGLPINFPFFQLQQFNKRTYLYGPELSELEKDKALKLKLWNALKQLFNV